ncbi:MAG: hypothetical protein Q4C83_03280 [Candidatus Saccharibacteria bacterium]|nr:hypothetical protein [Candidatus Saccharibacteria bacterium]
MAKETKKVGQTDRKFTINAIVLNMILAALTAVIVATNANLIALAAVLIIGSGTNYYLGRQAAANAPKADAKNSLYFRQQTRFYLPLAVISYAIAFTVCTIIYNSTWHVFPVSTTSTLLMSLAITAGINASMAAMFAQGLTYLPMPKRLALFKNRMRQNSVTACKIMALDFVILISAAITLIATTGTGKIATNCVKAPSILPIIVIAIITAICYFCKGRIIKCDIAKLPSAVQLTGRRMYIKMALVSLVVISAVIATIYYAVNDMAGNYSFYAYTFYRILAPYAAVFAVSTLALAIGNKR